MYDASAYAELFKAAGLPADFRDIIGKRVLLVMLLPEISDDFIGVLKSYQAVCKIEGVRIDRNFGLRLLFEDHLLVPGHDEYPDHRAPSSAFLPHVEKDELLWTISVTECDCGDPVEHDCWDWHEVRISLLD